MRTWLIEFEYVELLGSKTDQLLELLTRLIEKIKTQISLHTGWDFLKLELDTYNNKIKVFLKESGSLSAMAIGGIIFTVISGLIIFLGVIIRNVKFIDLETAKVENQAEITTAETTQNITTDSTLTTEQKTQMLQALEELTGEQAAQEETESKAQVWKKVQDIVLILVIGGCAISTIWLVKEMKK